MSKFNLKVFVRYPNTWNKFQRFLEENNLYTAPDFSNSYSADNFEIWDGERIVTTREVKELFEEFAELNNHCIRTEHIIIHTLEEDKKVWNYEADLSTGHIISGSNWYTRYEAFAEGIWIIFQDMEYPYPVRKSANMITSLPGTISGWDVNNVNKVNKKGLQNGNNEKTQKSGPSLD